MAFSDERRERTQSSRKPQQSAVMAGRDASYQLVMKSQDRIADTRIMRRAGRWAAALFWAIQFVELTAVSLTEGFPLARQMLLPRGVVMCVGLVLTLPIIEMAARTGHRPFRTRLVTTLGVALAMCALLLLVNYMTFLWLMPAKDTGFNLVDLVYLGYGWSWFFLGIGGALIGLSYSLETRDRERRLAVMEVVARDARLSALRYQLNPHFLFNTLNSIASLIEGNDKQEAEEMVVALSEFLRATLDLDPVADITLTEEVELQSVYLAIERVRFPERLITSLDLAPGTETARIPALLLQPLIENAVVHGVAQTDRPVEVRILSGVERGMLLLEVENDVFGESGDGGTGVGLSNVRARLESRFGSHHAMSAIRDGSKFRVVIEMPLDHSA